MTQGNSNFSILYVDDEEDNFTVFKAVFRRLYTIHLANSGEEGLRVMATQNIHIVITDQQMPGMNGITFLEHVASSYPATYRMILTGYGNIDLIMNAIDRGVAHLYLTKPWNKEHMLELMEECVRQYNVLIASKTP